MRVTNNSTAQQLQKKKKRKFQTVKTKQTFPSRPLRMTMRWGWSVKLNRSGKVSHSNVRIFFYFIHAFKYWKGFHSRGTVCVSKGKFLINSKTMQETPLAITLVKSPSNQLNVSINTGRGCFMVSEKWLWWYKIDINRVYVRIPSIGFFHEAYNVISFMLLHSLLLLVGGAAAADMMIDLAKGFAIILLLLLSWGDLTRRRRRTDSSLGKMVLLLAGSTGWWWHWSISDFHHLFTIKSFN